MSGKRHKKELWLDPRAKLFLILMCVLSSMFAPSLAYQFILVMLIAILGAFFGKWKYVIKAVCFYAVICAKIPLRIEPIILVLCVHFSSEKLLIPIRNPYTESSAANRQMPPTINP